MEPKQEELTLQGLEELQRFRGWKRFTYLSENQKDRSASDSIKVELNFIKMVVIADLADACVCFSGGNNCFAIYSVELVICHYFELYDLITFVCENGKRYTFYGVKA